MKQHNIDEHEQQQSIFDIWPDAEYPGLHRDIRAAVAAAVQAERERGDQRVLDECEACAQTIEMFDNDGEWIGKLEYVAAIRARHGLSTRRVA